MVNAYKVRLLSSELFYIFPHCYVRRFILLFSNKFAALKWKVIFQEEVLLMIFFVSYSIVWSHQKLIFEILQEIFFSLHYVSICNFAFALSEFKRISSLLHSPPENIRKP